MKFRFYNKQSLSLTIVLFYLIPILSLSFFSLNYMSKNMSWSVLTFGLLIMACGSSILMMLISYWEESIKKSLQLDFDHLTRNPSADENKVMALSSISEILENKDKVESFSSSHNYLKEIKDLEDSVKENQEKQTQLTEELAHVQMELTKTEDERKLLADQLEEIDTHFADLKLQSFQELNEKNLFISNLEKTIEEQKVNLEKKDQQIQELDSKTRDLSYEIKTLLYLQETEKESPSLFLNPKNEEPIKISEPKNLPLKSTFEVESQKHEIFDDSEDVIKTATEASILLKKCILLAQKQSSMNYYENETSRYWDIATPHFTIDQRRLFDSLKEETTGLILVYSPRESKLLFVNNLSKQWLGWSPEKFIQDFSIIIQEGLPEWKRSLSLLSSTPETQSRLLVKSKLGQEKMMYCHLGSISTGSFKNYVLGVLYPA